MLMPGHFIVVFVVHFIVLSIVRKSIRKRSILNQISLLYFITTRLKNSFGCLYIFLFFTVEFCTRSNSFSQTALLKKMTQTTVILAESFIQSNL